MSATNTYTVNGESAQTIVSGVADIDLSTETGVKAGCKEYPIPLLNKITVTSTDTGLSKSKTIYAGYKIIEQMLGSLVPAGNYNTETPLLNTIISNGRFGIFEPAHYSSYTGNWISHDLDSEQINSLLNVGTGIKICVRIVYKKVDLSTTTVYVPILGVSDSFRKITETTVPSYGELGVGAFSLGFNEIVDFKYLDKYDRRPWFESVLTKDILNVNLGSSIVDPDITENMTIMLMAYIGSIPTADNTFPIWPMTSGSQTSITVAFENENYNPLIKLYNKDGTNNPDTYGDDYGSVADYDTGTATDTTISVEIIAP